MGAFNKTMYVKKLIKVFIAYHIFYFRMFKASHPLFERSEVVWEELLASIADTSLRLRGRGEFIGLLAHSICRVAKLQNTKT
jgi:hypothetical protein